VALRTISISKQDSLIVLCEGRLFLIEPTKTSIQDSKEFSGTRDALGDLLLRELPLKQDKYGQAKEKK
jgi:hypothetical protein